MHACIPAFAWPNTECPKMWTAALKLQSTAATEGFVTRRLQFLHHFSIFLGSDELKQ